MRIARTELHKFPKATTILEAKQFEHSLILYLVLLCCYREQSRDVCHKDVIRAAWTSGFDIVFFFGPRGEKITHVFGPKLWKTQF